MPPECNADEVDFKEETQYDLCQLNRERINRQPSCDMTVYSMEGIEFPAHKRVLCEASEFFRLMISDGEFLEAQESMCQLKSLDFKTVSLLLDYYYTRKMPHFDKDIAFQVFIAAHFLNLNALYKYCGAIIARHPMDTVFEHEYFHSLPIEYYCYMENVLQLDLLITDPTRLRNAARTWLEIEPDSRANVYNEMVERLNKHINECSERALFYDRLHGICIVFSGNHWSQWINKIGDRLTTDTQHIALTERHLAFATPSQINIVYRASPLVYEETDIPAWPPLLRSHGRILYWTQENRKQLWMKAEGKSEKMVYNLQKRRCSPLIRYIASSDLGDYQHVTLVVTDKGDWRILHAANASRSSTLVDLNCPLVRIECATIIRNDLYVLGSSTANSVPTKMMKFEDGVWIPLSSRPRAEVPRAFVPLNGRVYVLCAAFPTVEVYEPSTNIWMIDPCADIGELSGFCTFDDKSQG